jgi:hypothetical protein
MRSRGVDHLNEFHLIKIVIFHLIKIVIFHLIKSFIFTWSNFLRLFTWSKVSIMHSIKPLKTCRLIKSFIKDLIKWKNLSVLFWHLIKSCNNSIFGFKNFQSSTKIRLFFFGSRSKVLIIQKFNNWNFWPSAKKGTFNFDHYIECTGG